MVSEPVSKRAKRLVKQLFELQLYDAELTAPACLSIKHCLRSSKHCRAVEVPPGPDTELKISTDRSEVYKFILSQLEIQRLTSQDPSAALVLSPLIKFILSCVPLQLFKEDTVPTLFYWQSFSTHRTFCVFAFISREAIMPSSTYSAEELLGLRDLAVPITLPDVPQKGDGPTPQQTARPIGSESRTLGRFHKFRPYHAQESGTVRTRPEFPVLPISAENPDYVQQQHRSHQDMDSTGPGETEWRYRGRTGSEAASAAEPLSAPTGLNAQQSEGFQRFYKAVISPTHVRVTAGGRIVPNTRGTSPMSKRFKDRPEDGDQAKHGAQNGEEQNYQLPEHAYLPSAKPPAMPLFAYPPHPFYPPFPANLPSMPIMHMGMGIGMHGGFPYAHQPPPHNNLPPMLPDLSRSLSKENQHNGQRREPSVNKFQTLDKMDGKTRRASSSQFDHQKPFMFSGQAVYPFPPPGFPSQLPHGNHAQLPPGFIGHPFPHAAFQAQMMGPPPPGMNHMLNQAMNFPGLPPAVQVPQGSQHQAPMTGNSVVAGATALSEALEDVAAPPVSSIRPSEISRKQIDMLRGSLKYHEDQLLYNKHQIDEKEMEHTIQMLQSQIDRFEILNQGQVRFEEQHYPKKEIKASKPSASHSRISERSSRNTGSGQSTVKHASGSIRRHESSRQKSLLRKKEPYFSLNPVESPVSILDPIKKSTLPSRAALAPPFEPRSLPGIGKEMMENTRPTFQWDGPVADVQGSTNDGGLGTGTHRDSRRSSSSEKSSDSRKPYLVGTLRPGVEPQNARETDYVYERELTQDETRSRYLYWGKAPSFTRKGLPKFDGKDFYPPSPSNGETMGLAQSSSIDHRAHSGQSSTEMYSTISQPKSPLQPRASVAGSYASSFSRERQKPVKVTIRRPDSDAVVKLQKVNIKPPKPAQASTSSDSTNGTSDHTKTRFLHNVLRRNMSSNSQVLPGALTSATVQGVLPQYSAGYDSLVAASLSPLSPPLAALGHASPSKSDEGSSVFLTPSSRKMGENRPPVDSTGPVSLEQRFKDIVSLESKHSAALPAQWTGL